MINKEHIYPLSESVVLWGLYRISCCQSNKGLLLNQRNRIRHKCLKGLIRTFKQYPRVFKGWNKSVITTKKAFNSPCLSCKYPLLNSVPIYDYMFMSYMYNSVKIGSIMKLSLRAYGVVNKSLTDNFIRQLII